MEIGHPKQDQITSGKEAVPQTYMPGVPPESGGNGFTLDKESYKFLFNRQDTAEIMNVTGKTLDEWKLDRQKIGRSVYYNIKQVVRARVAMLVQKEKLDLVAEQAQLAKIRRELLELEKMELEGDLIRVDTVKGQFFKITRTFRDAMLNIPNRVSGLLAAETIQARVFSLLTKEITQALKCLKH